jgi:hypothetical protein
MTNGTGTKPEHRPATDSARRLPRTLLHAMAALLAACLMALGAAASANAAPAADDLIKVFVVPDPAQTGGQLATLQSIATSTLGDASRADEILDLNRGQTQKDGGALNSAADQLHPGWILRLPQDASGSDVQLARDTGSQNSVSAAPSSGQQSAAPSTGQAAAFTFPLAAAIALLGAILLALITAGIVGRRRVRTGYAAVRRTVWRLGEPMRRRRRLASRRATSRRFATDADSVRRAYGAGQQGADVLGVAGVVQHDEDAPVGEEAAVQRGLRVEPRGDPLTGNAERVEEGPDGLGRAHDRTAGMEAAQIDVELPVGEPVRDTVRPVHRQGGLADAGHAADRTDHHRRRRQQRLDAGEFTPPTGEGGQIHGELGRTDRGDPVRPRRLGIGRLVRALGRLGRGMHGVVASEDALQSGLQFGAWLYAQLVGEARAYAPVHVQGLGLVPGGREHQDQSGLQPFVQRVLRGGLPERHQHPCAQARSGFQGEFGGFLDGGHVLAVEGGEGRVTPHLGRDPGGRRPAPQGQRLDQQPCGDGRLVGLRGLLPQGPEAQQVEIVGLHFEAVAARATHQPP